MCQSKPPHFWSVQALNIFYAFQFCPLLSMLSAILKLVLQDMLPVQLSLYFHKWIFLSIFRQNQKYKHLCSQIQKLWANQETMVSSFKGSGGQGRFRWMHCQFPCQCCVTYFQGTNEGGFGDQLKPLILSQRGTSKETAWSKPNNAPHKKQSDCKAPKGVLGFTSTACARLLFQLQLALNFLTIVQEDHLLIMMYNIERMVIWNWILYPRISSKFH